MTLLALPVLVPVLAAARIAACHAVWLGGLLCGLHLQLVAEAIERRMRQHEGTDACLKR
jgi:hypothetical protein